MKLFLGVDGGQSSTVALIADETGRVIGAGSGGACNHVAKHEGRAKFARAMGECIGEACRQAGLDAASVAFEAACLGFSGGTDDKEAYSRELIRSRSFKITIDAEIALSGATGGQPGIIVIAGTGSIAFGKNSSGKTARAGGWGYIFGDEGGAFDIVRQALRAALAMEEGGGAATDLRAALLAETQADSANQLLHDWYNAFDRTRIAQLAPLVDRAARSGDEAAQGILKHAGGQLANLAAAVHRVLFPAGEPAAISAIGGVFSSALVSQSLAQAVRTELGIELQSPLWPPAAGALWEALRLAGNGANVSNIPTIKR